MSRPASSSGGPAGAATAPSGLVTVIVGEAGRSSSRSKSRQGASRAQSAKGAGASAAGGTGGESTAQDGKGVTQWSRRWSSDGPGPVLPRTEDASDLTLTIGTEDARRIKDGELDASVAFMQGKLKSSGDNALLLRILDWSTTAGPAEALGWPSEAAS
jgi:SCP-2 sterol transfer family